VRVPGWIIAAGRPIRIATPGIRMPGDAAGDQRRVATPAQAVARGADHLVVFTNDVKPPPIERTWAESLPGTFMREYADDAGAVYRIVWP